MQNTAPKYMKYAKNDSVHINNIFVGIQATSPFFVTVQDQALNEYIYSVPPKAFTFRIETCRQVGNYIVQWNRRKETVFLNTQRTQLLK